MSPLQPAAVPTSLTTLRVGVLVAGGIAAYKVADLVSLLTQAGSEVRVAMTHSAQRFVGAATFHGLSGSPVVTDLWSPTGPPEPHVVLGDWAQVVLVAPATANVLARIAGGEADDLVTTTVLAARAPVVVAPAMNDTMWAKPAVRENIARLRASGVTVVQPEEGRLASGHRGAGRLASHQAILRGLQEAVSSRYDMGGRRVVVSAGGTREPIDPVRFVSNYSSGKMGFALAAAAAERGAQVVLVTTADTQHHPGVVTQVVETADQMLKALRRHLDGAHLLVMAAAVADYRPVRKLGEKIQRESGERLTLDLERNVDILAELGRERAAEGVFRLGFAAEAGDPLPRAHQKLASKALDAIVANDISREDSGFGSDYNAGALILRGGGVIPLPRMPKREMADRILDAVVPLLARRTGPEQHPAT